MGVAVDKVELALPVIASHRMNIGPPAPDNTKRLKKMRRFSDSLAKRRIVWALQSGSCPQKLNPRVTPFWGGPTLGALRLPLFLEPAKLDLDPNEEDPYVRLNPIQRITDRLLV